MRNGGWLRVRVVAVETVLAALPSRFGYAKELAGDMGAPLWIGMLWRLKKS